MKLQISDLGLVVMVLPLWISEIVMEMVQMIDIKEAQELLIHEVQLEEEGEEEEEEGG